MKVSKVALAAATVLGGSALVGTPALAQQQNQAQQNQQGQAQQPRLNLSRAEQAALNPLIQANAAAAAARQQGQTPDWAAVRALLPAAEAAARSNDAKYLLARVQLEVALGADDLAGQERALAALLANPSTPAAFAETLRSAQNNILNQRAEAAFRANDFATAERIYVQLQQANPNDQRIINNLALVRARMGNTEGALEPVLAQIRTAEAAGQRAAESLYQRAWRVPYAANQRPQALEALRRLLAAYPTPANWQLALDVVREGGGSDVGLLLDTFRLARVANAVRANEYLPFAASLDQAGLPGETKAVIDAGIAAGVLQASNGDVSRLLGVANRRIAEDRAGLAGQMAQARSASRGQPARIVADALFGYQRYAEAAEMYRLALSKGGEDANLVNTRLGATLALAGQRAEAEAALRAVTGPRAELASLWLAWLASRPA
ncbi:MAG: hypothetical protein ACK4SZ_16960 [Allosphingosinicella sp.]|uniref:hypothetical protein n=1 Tax=Allosphingosinicella sp. TaxID=2823234 RepID=UPI00394F7C88